MKTAAIIAEYNPFHNGHALHISRTRRDLGATHVVAVMSGSFVQRGDAALCPKSDRVQMALRGGVDLVIELPLPWAMAGAERFARGGVALASALGCADMLSFGSECGSIERIRAAAEYIDSPAARKLLREHMSAGVTYAAARAAAGEQYTDVLGNPNDLLGVEYCRAVIRLAPELETVCIRREGAAHDSDEAAALASASHIRSLVRQRDEGWRSCVPPATAELLGSALETGTAPAEVSRLDRALLCRLRGMTPAQLALLPDVTEGLENRIASAASEICGEQAGFERLCDLIKCKRYTRARIRRVLLSALLGLTAEDAAGLPPYLRVLGMNERGREILAAANPTLPIITRFSQLADADERSRRVFALEAAAADVYALMLPSVGGAGSEQRFKLVVERQRGGE